MPVQSELKADISAEKQGNRKRLVATTNGLTISIALPIIGDFSKLRVKNQILTGCFWGFAWFKAVG